MTCHPISDVHEWINEIPTVPIYYLVKPQPKEQAWWNQRGKKTLLSLTLVESRDWEIERERQFWLAILKTEVHGLGIDWGCKPK